MRFVLAAALTAGLAACMAAHADTLSVSYTVNGNGVSDGSTYDIVSTPFAQFDPAKGTLSSIEISVSGTATTTYFGKLQSITAQTDPSINYNSNFSHFGSSSIPFSFDETSTDGLANFVGPGTQALVVGFALPIGGAVTTTNTSGTLTYNYTPSAVTVTPEPSSFLLLGTGLLGIVSTIRRKNSF